MQYKYINIIQDILVQNDIYVLCNLYVICVQGACPLFVQGACPLFVQGCVLGGVIWVLRTSISTLPGYTSVPFDSPWYTHLTLWVPRTHTCSPTTHTWPLSVCPGGGYGPSGVLKGLSVCILGNQRGQMCILGGVIWMSGVLKELRGC